jgi:hypothetical protein
MKERNFMYKWLKTNKELMCRKMLNCTGTTDVTKCAEKVRCQWQDEVKEM